MTLSRRSFLSRALALGCSAGASPLITPVTLAAAPWENRLVVILLRGGMDGLGVVQPYGDAGFAGLRGAVDLEGPRSSADLDGRFALHPALAPLRPLWQAGELGFAHAVSTPYRGKRSHFDGQDLLEAGTSRLAGARDGWLNRLLQVAGSGDPQTAFALGRENLMLLSGPAPHFSWSPEADLDMSPQARLLSELVMSGDPAFATALQEAFVLTGQGQAGPEAGVEAGRMTEEMAGGMSGEMSGGMSGGMAGGMSGAADPGMMADMQDRPPIRGGGHKALARYAGRQLAGAARIAAFSLNGWDTHRQQGPALTRSLTRLAEVLEGLRAELGPVWRQTAVLAMTEFGRTARLNGTAGTDHGTGGAMLFAGGALRGGQVVTDWPGLSEADLYEGRDLWPTRDIRAHAAWVMRSLFGISVADLERQVFPGLEMGPASKLLL